MKKSKEAYAVVMAGGRGERFWPQSRLASPKQLLRLLGNLTLIEQTIERLTETFLPENIFIVTNEMYVDPMRKLISSIAPENIIGEPCSRDTAPCMAASASFIRVLSSAEDPMLCFLPSDHMIEDRDAFARVLSDSMDFASSSPDSIVTLGIRAREPQTGYGYIKAGEKLSCSQEGTTIFCKGDGFYEKPSLATARTYVEDGSYFWNAGIFVMRSSALKAAVRTAAPDLADFMDIAETLFAEKGLNSESVREPYEKLKTVSVDYAVMENISNIVVALADFDWDDVGSWTSLRSQIEPSENNNIVKALHKGIQTENCIIVGDPQKLIATLNVKDLVIVDTEDALLVCDAGSAQHIKELVKQLAADPELKKFV